MVSPRRQYPPDPALDPAPKPQLHEHSPASKSPASGKWRVGYSWIILALILGVWYVGFGWGNSGGWIWGHSKASAPVANKSEASTPGVVILEVANKQDYIGQSFQISDVSVDHWSSPRAVWIGSRHSYLPMLLVLSSASPLAPALSSAARPDDSGVGASAGSAPLASAPVQHLDVKGTIIKAPPTVQAQRQWHLSDEDVDQLEQEGVFIQATAVQPAKH
jgi:hypothetical protein